MLCCQPQSLSHLTRPPQFFLFFLLSHHSLSLSFCACNSVILFLRFAFCASSLADWKMVWPQPGWNAFASLTTSLNSSSIPC